MSHYDDIDEARIDLIGQNGNTGEHYDMSPKMPKLGDTVKFRMPIPHCLQPTSLSVQLLQHCRQVQEERGRQYDKPDGERSFQRTATAFNAITGKNLRGSEVALLLQILKDVRQWSNIDQLHVDSLIDGTSYSSLKAEELMREHGVEGDLPC